MGKTDITAAIGTRFDRLVVIAEAPPYIHRSYTRRRVAVICDCGKEKIVHVASLERGLTRSCGCLQKEIAAAHQTIHGEGAPKRASREWKIWNGMIRRCVDPGCSTYRTYGARGIKVCDRWRHGEDGKTGFECFLSDMGRRPSPAHSLDRYPNQVGNYAPGNVRWATSAQQTRNKTTNRRVVINGEKMIFADACRVLGVNVKAAQARLSRGATAEQALGLPA